MIASLLANYNHMDHHHHHHQEYQVPRPDNLIMLQNVNRSSLLFLQKARIKHGSMEHKQLLTTIRSLYHQYLDPCKYVEEQESDANRLIARAKVCISWLSKYEDAWPARVYLKRYVDMKRPHLKCSRQAHSRKPLKSQKSKPCHKKKSDVPLDGVSAVREFLSSLSPSLEHRLDAFIESGVKDQKTLTAFLSWPQFTQAQFLDDSHGVLQLTNLEKRGLLVGCGMLTHGVMRASLVGKVQSLLFNLAR